MSDLKTVSNTCKKWSWKAEPKLMEILRSLQNSNENCNRDIVTIVGFFSTRSELVDHINRNGGDVK